MTSEDLNKLPFKCVLHLSMCHEHTTSYIAETPFFKLEACVHVPFKDGEPCGKLYTHYLLNGKVYKSKKKLLEEINSRNLTREIKFRAKDKFTGQWRYGDLVHNQRVTTTGLEPRAMIDGYEVLENTVGQYTGLKDKKGKEIYEGDIIKPNPKYITSNCIVVWDNIELKLKTEYWCNFFAEYVWGGCEVIGNIFDNPELIKE